jgi:ABC-2 type transport system ATP-binding protein
MKLTIEGVGKILATITRPTEGRAAWDGADIVAEPDRLRAALGYLPQDFASTRT